MKGTLGHVAVMEGTCGHVSFSVYTHMLMFHPVIGTHDVLAFQAAHP
jgi:hypothetical protein